VDWTVNAAAGTATPAAVKKVSISGALAGEGSISFGSDVTVTLAVVAVSLVTSARSPDPFPMQIGFAAPASVVHHVTVLPTGTPAINANRAVSEVVTVNGPSGAAGGKKGSMMTNALAPPEAARVAKERRAPPITFFSLIMISSWESHQAPPYIAEQALIMPNISSQQIQSFVEWNALPTGEFVKFSDKATQVNPRHARECLAYYKVRTDPSVLRGV
jgi:hypothetical protein